MNTLSQRHPHAATPCTPATLSAAESNPSLRRKAVSGAHPVQLGAERTRAPPKPRIGACPARTDAGRLLLNRPPAALIMTASVPDLERGQGQSQAAPWTVDDFLTFEAEEPERYEFVDGIVRMMTGASAAHSAIKGNIAVALERGAASEVQLAPDLSDLKVVTESAVMYPDVLVARRPLAPDDDRLPDPTVVVEVLSPATRAPSIGSPNGVSTRGSPRSGITS